MSARSDGFEKQLGGRYRFEGLVGKGAMGEVWSAHDKKFERAVAIKILAANLSDDAEFVARFHREYKTLAKFSHPRIVAIHDAGAFAEGGRLYMIMEMLPGRTLRALLDEHRAGGMVMSPVTAAFHTIQMLDGLGAAHDQGIIHRDVKPENMIVNVSGHLKLVDFGVAKAAERAGRRLGEGAPGDKPFRTKESQLVGTPRYMSPELIAGRPIDHRADLYAVGVTLVFMLTGEYVYPVDPRDEMAVLKAHLEQAPVLLREKNPDCPENVWAVALKLLEKDPDDRFADADAASEELSAFLRQSAPPGHPMEKVIRAERRERAHRRAYESFGSVSVPPSAPPAQASADDVTEEDAAASATRRTDLLPGDAYAAASPCSPAALALAATAPAARGALRANRGAPPGDATQPVGAGRAPAPFLPAWPGVDETRQLPAGAVPPPAREPFPLARPGAPATAAGAPARLLPRVRVRRLKDRLLVLSGVALGVLGSFALVVVVLVLVSRTAVPPSVGPAGATTAPGRSAAPPGSQALPPAPAAPGATAAEDPAAPGTSTSAAPRPVPRATSSATAATVTTAAPSATAAATATPARRPAAPARRPAPAFEPVRDEPQEPGLRVLPRSAASARRPNDPPPVGGRIF